VADRIAIPIIILVHNTPKEGQNSKEEKEDTKSDTTTSSNNDNTTIKNKD
jgi:hypothetical protein